MEKVKTLVESLKGGYEKAFDYLDARVNSLGEIRIKEIKDTVYPIGSTLEQNKKSYIERIVVYYEKKPERKEGEPWRPTLDTDLQTFIWAAEPERKVKILLEEAYAQDGINTIRDLIAQPYGWFRSISTKPKEWKDLQLLLDSYGIKLRKEGNVIED